MPKNNITCPNCNHEFEATEAILINLKKDMQKEILQMKESLEKEKDAEAIRLKETLQKEFEKQLEQVRQSTEEFSKKSMALKYELEIKLLKEESERANKKEAELLQKESFLKQEENRIKEELSFLQRKLIEKDSETQELLKRERLRLELEFNSSKAEDSKKLFELENSLRLLQQEKEIQINQIKMDARREADKILEEEKHRLLVDKDIALKEFSERNERLQAKLDEMQRQLKSKDNEAIGEAFENYVEGNLELKFAGDVILPVAKGVNGVDMAIDVISGNKKCGTMLIECKYADNWSSNWIDKAGEDKRNAKADLVVIISKVLPKGMNRFGVINGVFVVDTVNYLSLLPILRMKVEELGLYKLANTDRKSKVEQLFNYLASVEFRGVLEHAEAVTGSMQKVLDNDKKVALKSFKMRQDDIDSIKEALLDIGSSIESKLTVFEGIDVEVENEILLIEKI